MSDQAETGLPSGWEVRHSNSKNLPYYFNAAEKNSRWEPPEGTNTEKLKVYMAKYHSGTFQPAEGAQPGKIRAAHLLVKHAESRRPSSWREKCGNDGDVGNEANYDPLALHQASITRTKDEAREIIKRHEETIKSGKSSLGDLAETESDCSSARKRGDLGYFGRGDMQKEFEDAAFALQPGEISGIVDTASGLHLIERLE
ncbi:rotamase-domain-containing protein [Coniochaeta ligniaria NRRL 30616]|uniref:Peptidyl-prolyl cis-trans isomerase n=1 Tax=Coniochaeta ligniaria NRRL 30616 TaxID=1408157 RepID=A0A1J7IZI5_9PEZI|nr:rotamase-domain-containing protein [Coniochaeta ligniaria NRRL 30616]